MLMQGTQFRAPRASKTRIAIVALSCLMIVSCGSSGGGGPSEPEESRDSKTFNQAVNRTCSRLGLAFTQTDVGFLLDELSNAVAGTGYTDTEAVDALRSVCPAKVDYANALP